MLVVNYFSRVLGSASSVDLEVIFVRLVFAVCVSIGDDLARSLDHYFRQKLGKSHSTRARLLPKCPTSTRVRQEKLVETTGHNISSLGDSESRNGKEGLQCGQNSGRNVR